MKCHYCLTEDPFLKYDMIPGTNGAYYPLCKDCQNENLEDWY